MLGHFWSRIAVVQDVKKPLPCCYFLKMHVPAGRLIKHHQKARCNRNTQMRWRIRDLDIAAKSTGETFSLTGKDGAECFEGVESFKYLGRVLNRLDEDWPAVFRNIWRARQVWGRLGKLLRR